ncbi:MAG: RHS repeat-associated core domain-containing protein, partial [Proteobacteria bacterium]|nr:RHS repeat-associated core domain-containing protein [Pseudomonadota bacterium]
GTTTLTVRYDQAGNITSKSDVGTYTYGDSLHPHAVTAAGSWAISYDNNGNMKSRAGGSITSSSYNLPTMINYNGNSTAFSYNSDHQRWRQDANYGGNIETTHYIGGLLQTVSRSGGGPVEFRHLIPAGSSSAIYIRRSDGTSSTFYATSDHLGSADLVLDAGGGVLARESFGPFGARRGSNWQGVPTTADYTTFSNTTRQGFTGHEMLDSVGLVHMNGRVYDPTLGRFLSADTVIQTLGSSQAINPYAYAWNDPLKYMDPSGHSLLGDIVGAIVGAVLAYFTFGASYAFLASEYVVGAGVYAGALAGFVGGFVGALISTGSLSAALTAGLISGVVGGLTAGIGVKVTNGDWTPAEGVIARIGVGCA